MLIDDLTDVLVQAKQGTLFGIRDIFNIIDRLPRRVVFGTSKSDRILADLDPFSFDSNNPAFLEAYTACRILTEEEKQRYLNKLRELNIEYPPQDKESAFRISFIIKSAFDYNLDFMSFRELAYLAGYSFHKNTCYPPYFFLQYALYKKIDYNEYIKGLTDTNNIMTLLKEDILRLKDNEHYYFQEKIIKDFLLSHQDKYKLSFLCALEDPAFQADFIRDFFERVYITGELEYNRT